ncbi:MAG: hypothetical protein ABIJ50_04635 [Pseudomonadota bacterium]
MGLTIQQLSENRKNWVEASRENGFEDGIKRLLTDLYPDNAHFIYELLQNAEDAGASQVLFILNDDSLEFEHNGDRLFSIANVAAITSIGVSTKKDDHTSIGKFGVGFKAVFAYTNTPEIHSGDFHFRIRDLVVPDTDDIAVCSREDNLTRFVFPFDNPKKSKKNARNEIERNLRQLNENTLLFLKNIQKIEFLLPNATMGSLERNTKDKNRIEIFVQYPEGTEPTSVAFLRFEKMVDVHDEDREIKSCRISVAFSMVENKVRDEEKPDKRSKRKRTDRWEIRPLEHGQVSIYFPADKETSNLRFHLHAPFASTVARDSVRDCPSNNELRDHLATFIAESMAAIRDQGLLTVGFLATLPNDKDNLSSFYKPIQNSLIQVFQNEDLTPMKQGGHSAASGIFRGTAQLSNLILDEDFAMLFGEDYIPPMWVANPPQKNQREDNFLLSLDISECTTEDLVNALSEYSDQTENWLGRKLDEWHQGLYVLLGEYLSNAPSSPYYAADRRRDSLRRLPIIRRNNGTYSVGRECFFPSVGVEDDELMPRVAKGVYASGKSEEQRKKAKEFLEIVGVREVGEAEQIETILKNRYSQYSQYSHETVDPKSLEPDIKDIKRFVALVEQDPSRASLFNNYFILKMEDKRWGRPCDVYLDSPFMETGLNAYYEVIDDDKIECRALSQEYKACGVDLGKIGNFAKKVGAKTLLDIAKHEGYNSVDYTIEHLKDILQLKNISISLLIWKIIIHKENGLYYPQTDYFYKQSRPDRRYNLSIEGDSSVIRILKISEWIPQKNYETKEFTFVKPAEADSKLLPDGFFFDNGWQWVKALEFGTIIRQREEVEDLEKQRKTSEYQRSEETAKKFGFDSFAEAKEMAELKQKDPEGYKKWLGSNKEKPFFPNRTVANPERRQERLNEQLGGAPKKKYEKCDRSVRTTRGAVDPDLWLREQYTNDDDQMVCQICKEELPFKKRNGQYYFVAVEALSNIFFSKEHEAQFLALCPLCAAMYKEFVKLDDIVITRLNNAIKTSEKPEVSLKLGELETSIRFVESHWLDMKTILK